MPIESQVYRGGGISDNFFDKTHCWYIIFVIRKEIFKIKDKWMNEWTRKERSTEEQVVNLKAIT